jgi:hypothetical protein
MKCDFVSPGFMQKLLLLTYGSQLLVDTNISKLKKLYKVPADITIKGKYITVEDIVEVFKAAKILLLKLPLGCGKTSAVMKYIYHLCESQPDIRILFITCRIALTIEQREKLHKSFETYLDEDNRKKKCFFAYPRLACSIQSLHKVHGRYDLVILDEIETILTSFTGKAECHFTRTKSNLVQNWMNFCDTIKDTPQVIAMDGLMSNISIDFIKGLRDDKSVVIKSKHKQTERQIQLCYSIEVMYDQVYRALEAGDKIFVGVPGKGDKKVDMSSVEGMVSDILVKFPTWKRGVQVIGYHSAAGSEKAALKNCEEVWGSPNTRIVIGNASIAVGVSYDPKFSDKYQQFDTVFASMNPTCMSNHDFFQLLYRIRKPKNSKMFIHLGKVGKDFKNAQMMPILYKQPVDKVWLKLREGLGFKHNADMHSRTKQIFKFFCDMMNIKYNTKDTIKMSEEEIQQIVSAFDGHTHNMFRWDAIEDITNETYNRYVYRMKNTVLPIKCVLQIQKFMFTRKFQTKESAKLFWQTEGHRCIERIHDLMVYQKYPEESIFWIDDYHQCSVISDILQRNNITIGEDLEDIKYGSTKAWKKYFNLRLNDFKMDMIYKLFFAYFKSKAVLGREELTRRGHYAYKTGILWKDSLNHLVVGDIISSNTESEDKSLLEDISRNRTEQLNGTKNLGIYIY